jgi:hypothetical protein
MRDKELFEIDRNIIARIVYKGQYQYRSIDLLERVKSLVKLIDEFIISKDTRMLPQVIDAVERAAERYFQQLSMGLMVPQSMAAVGGLSRLAEILRRIPVSHPISIDMNNIDEGVPVPR